MKLSKNMTGLLTAIWEHTESKKAIHSDSWYWGRYHGRTKTALISRGLIEANKSYGTLLAHGRKDCQSVVLTDAGRKALDDMAAAEGLTIDQWWCPARPDLWRDASYTVADMERAWKVYDLRSYGEAQDRTVYIAQCMAEKRASAMGRE